jgi:hypothetical protein
MTITGQEDNIGEGSADVYTDPVIRHIDRILKSIG